MSNFGEINNFMNYCTASNTQGWCYSVCNDFIANYDFTSKQLEEINANSPALETFLVVTQEMKTAKSEFEETARRQIEMKKTGPTYGGRGMAA